MLRAVALVAGAPMFGGCASPRSVELPPPVAPFPAVALDVASGDEFVVRHARSQRVETIRLVRVEAPERYQPYGAISADALRMTVSDQSLVVSAVARDAEGRLLAWVCLSEEPYFTRWSYPPCETGESINQALVREGHAWASRSVPQDRNLAEAQQMAQSLRAGLWAAEAPIPPWQWRLLSREKQTAILAAATPTPGLTGALGDRSEPSGAALVSSSFAPPYRSEFPVAIPQGGTDRDFAWLFLATSPATPAVTTGAVPGTSHPTAGQPAAPAPSWLDHWRALAAEFF